MMNQKSEYDELISITLPLPPHMIPSDIPIKKLKSDQQWQIEINGLKIELKQNEQQQVQKQILISNDDDKITVLGEVNESWEYQGLQDMQWKAQENIHSIIDQISQQNNTSNNENNNKSDKQQVDVQEYDDLFRTGSLIRPCYSSICVNNFIQPEEHRQTIINQKVEQEEDRNSIMYEILTSLFYKKKVWIKQHMEQKVLQVMQQQKQIFKKRIFKKLIVQISEDHKYGPWKNCYICNSYDPTKYVEAVKYQTIALKSNQVSDFNELKPKIIIYQLQEIKHPVVQQLIEQCANREQQYHKKWGWLKDKEYFTIYKTMKSQHNSTKYDLIKSIICPPIQ